MDKRTGEKKLTFITLPYNKAGCMISDPIEPSEMVPDVVDSHDVMPEPLGLPEIMPDLTERETAKSCDRRLLSALPENLSTVVPENLSKLTESQFKNLVNKFISGMKMENLCESILQITVICQSPCFTKCPVYPEYAAKALKNIRIYKNPGILMLSQGLFLTIMTHQELNAEHVAVIKKLLLSYFEKNDVSCDYFTEDSDEIRVNSLPDTSRLLAEYILTNDFHSKLLSSGEKNTFFLWCVATVNILSKKSQGSTIDIDFSWAVCKNMLKRIHSFHRLCEIESVDASNVYDETNYVLIVQWLSKLEICFGVLQVILADKTLIEKTLDHAESILLFDIKGLLVYFINELFVKKNKDDVILVLKATAMSMLKVLLSLSAVQRSGFEKHGVFLIEKLVHFIIQAHYTTFKERFGLQVMSLEVCLLILENKWIPREQYCFLLRMKIELKKTELVVVDALIKVLMHSLEIIKHLEGIKIHTIPGVAANFLTKRFPYEDVQQFGEDHMEHNFVVSYVSVLLAVFCVENVTYKAHIQNIIQRTDSNACINVLQKFKEFLILMENLNPIGRRLIEKTISVFRAF